MKKLLLITGLFLLSVLQTNGQDWNSKRDSIRYAVAYEYIVNDSVMVNQKISLSEKFINTKFSFFGIILESYIRKDNESNYDYYLKLHNIDNNSIDKNSKKYNYKDWYDDFDGKIRELYFSNIIDSFLFAMVDFTDSTSHFGHHYDYCFIFDLDNTIKKVFREEAHGL